jgi:peptidylprolyl isomerase
VKLGVQMLFSSPSAVGLVRIATRKFLAIVPLITALLLIALPLIVLPLSVLPPAFALPQGNAVTDPKAILRNSLPIDNPEVRTLQAAIEDISQQIRANRRWGAIGSDLSKAERLIKDKRDNILAAIASDTGKAQAGSLIDEIQSDIDQMRIDLEGKKKEALLTHRAELLGRVTTIEELMLGEFPYEVPAEYSAMPQLKGRATIEFNTDKGSVTAVLDGYSAPVTTGNFVDLIQRGFYDGLPFTRAEDFYVLQTGDPDGPDEGFIDPKTKTYRSVPLEILVKGDKVPTYGVTLEDAGRYLDQPVLPFSAYGALAMARPNEDANGGSSQFFFFLFEPELTPAGLNLLDGRYSIFGYVTSGQDVLHEIKAGDKITQVKVIKGLENFQKGAS